MPSKKPKILLVIDEELIEKVDDYRFDSRISSRAEAIRQLIKEGLKSKDLKPSKKSKE